MIRFQERIYYTIYFGFPESVNSCTIEYASKVKTSYWFIISLWWVLRWLFTDPLLDILTYLLFSRISNVFVAGFLLGLWIIKPPRRTVEMMAGLSRYVVECVTILSLTQVGLFTLTAIFLCFSGAMNQFPQAVLFSRNAEWIMWCIMGSMIHWRN